MVLRVRSKAKKWVVDEAAQLLLASFIIPVCRLSLAFLSLQKKSFLDSYAVVATFLHALTYALWSSRFNQSS
jgi:hypothetical protein